MANQYELVFIMTPVLSEEQMDETVKRYSNVIKDAGNEIVSDERWGLRKLAYPIQKKSTGYYHSIEFGGKGDIIPTLELAMKRDEKLLRFLTTKMDKHAVAYSIKRRTEAANKKKTKAEATSETKAETKVETEVVAK